MKEFACQFGEHGRLSGIVTVPNRSLGDRTAVVLVTAGFSEKTGPFRLYTQLARECSKLGFHALRFDLGGIGNSTQIHPGLPVQSRTKLDIQAALEFLEDNYGIDRFVIGGLCSGAEDSFRYARDDQRVRGVFLIDGHAYKTPGYWINQVTSLKFYLKWTINAIKWLTQRSTISEEDSSIEGEQTELIDYQRMPIEESSKILKTLLNRDTRIQYIYTGGLDHIFNHKNQWYKMFPDLNPKGLVTVNHLPMMGHIQVFQEDRQQMITVISQWLSKFTKKVQAA